MKRQDSYVVHLADLLWRGLADWRLTVVLSAWLALVAMLAALIPDLPSTADDPRVLSRWLAGIPSQVWPVVTWLRDAGFLPIHTSLLCRLPLAVLLSHSLVAVAFWLPPCLRRAGVRSENVLPAAGDEVESAFSVYRWLPGPDGSSMDERDRERRRERGGQEEVPGDGARDHRRSIWLALPGMYFGLCLMSLGLLMTSWLGEASHRRLEMGAAESFGSNDSWHLTLEQVLDLGAGPPAKPAPAVLVTVSPPFSGPHHVVLPLNQGRMVGPNWLVLVRVAPVAELSAARSGTGEPLSLYPLASPDSPERVVRLPLSPDQGAAFAAVVGKGLMVAVEVPMAATPAANVPVSVFRGVETMPALSTVVLDGDEFSFDDIQFRLQLDQEAEIRIRPGLWWLPTASGGGILVACLLLLMLVPPLRLRRATGADSGRAEETWLLEGPTSGDMMTLPAPRTGFTTRPSPVDALRLGMVVLTGAVTGLSLYSWWTQAQLSLALGRWLAAIWLLGLAGWMWSTFVHESSGPFRG